MLVFDNTKTQPDEVKSIENKKAGVVIKHTIDNITYTIKPRSSDTATQTLRDKLEATIARDISQIT